MLCYIIKLIIFYYTILFFIKLNIAFYCKFYELLKNILY